MNLKINNLLGGNDIYSDKNTLIKITNNDNLYRAYTNKLILIPIFQRNIDEQKILEIKTNILENTEENWIIQQGVIIIGVIQGLVTDNLYVLDGQHRLLAINSLYELKKNNIKIIVTFIRFDNIDKMKKYFVNININSKIEPIYTYFLDDIIKTTILKTRKWLNDCFNNSFRKTKNKSEINHNYNLDEFIRLFTPDRIKLFFDKQNSEYDNIDLLLDRIIIVNLMVTDYINELQISNKRKYYISDKDYEKCIKYNFYLAYEQINGIDLILLENTNIEIQEIYKSKIKISSKMRKEVWKKRNGSNMNGNCYCCNDDIEYDCFHCGHIISEFNGGLTNLQNIEPICQKCNLSMGIKNMNDYKSSLLLFIQNNTL